MSYQQKLSNFLVKHLKEQNMSYKEFSKLTGVAMGSITNYVQMKTEPELMLLYNISIHTHIDLFSMLGIDKQGHYLSMIEKVRRCKGVLERIETEITTDLVKNLDLASMVVEEDVNDQEMDDEQRIYENVSRYIMNYVHTADISYTELAKRVKVDKSQISLYINRQNLPTLPIALELCKIMKLSIQEFIGLQLDGINEIDKLYNKLLDIENKLIEE